MTLILLFLFYKGLFGDATRNDQKEKAIEFWVQMALIEFVENTIEIITYHKCNIYQYVFSLNMKKKGKQCHQKQS